MDNNFLNGDFGNFFTPAPPQIDPIFLEKLKAAGVNDLEKCYHCSSCIDACPLSSRMNPFPKKEMLWAQQGQYDKLVNDPDIWLCHQCNDCVPSCGQGASPGDIMAVSRRFCFEHFAVPKYMGKVLQHPRYLPVLFAVPIILLFIILLINNTFIDVPKGNNGAIVYDYFLPMDHLNILFTAVSIFSILFMGISLGRYWKGIKEYAPPFKEIRMGIIKSFLYTVVDVLSHRRFRKCGENWNRNFGHSMVLWGFIGLFLTTISVFIFVHGKDFGLFDGEKKAQLSVMTNIFDVTNKQSGIDTPFGEGAQLIKIVLANGSAFIFVLGGILLMVNRLYTRKKSNPTSYDWIFMAFIFLTGLTGWFAQWFRLWEWASSAYIIYFIHLVFVFYIIAYFPYSKLAHVAYRFISILYAYHTGRDTDTALK